jgi:hypothetical protein
LEVIVLGIPELEKTKALAQDAADVSDKGMASIHLHV